MEEFTVISIEDAGNVSKVLVPAYPHPCSYVRITVNGVERHYWDSEEWSECPEEVMGAIMGAIGWIVKKDRSIDRR